MLVLSYSFLVIILGTIFLSFSSAIVGAINLYKGQSLIGDALGHSTFPGIVLFFIFFSTRDPLILLLGAIATSSMSYFLIQLSSRYSKLNLDSSLAIFLTGFFGLGMLIKSLIQGNFKKVSQAGLEHYIFGQAAYMLEKDVKLIIIISVVIIALFIIFKRELVIYTFDQEFAKTRGMNIRLVEYLILCMTIVLVSVGLKAVGTILISSFLILPTVCASHWSKNFNIVLVISCITALVSSFIGTYVSSLYRGFSTGPAIIVVMGTITILSVVFGRYGVVKKLLSFREKKC